MQIDSNVKFNHINVKSCWCVREYSLSLVAVLKACVIQS